MSEEKKCPYIVIYEEVGAVICFVTGENCNRFISNWELCKIYKLKKENEQLKHDLVEKGY